MWKQRETWRFLHNFTILHFPWCILLMPKIWAILFNLLRKSLCKSLHNAWMGTTPTTNRGALAILSESRSPRTTININNNYRQFPREISQKPQAWVCFGPRILEAVTLARASTLIDMECVVGRGDFRWENLLASRVAKWRWMESSCDDFERLI